MTPGWEPTADSPPPHGGHPVVTAGAPRGGTRAVVVSLHGRGATAQGVVNLLSPVARHGVTFVAPQAARSRWYPGQAEDPLSRNEPELSSALGVVDDLLGSVGEHFDAPRDTVVLVGFSQGACVAAEYAARNPGEFGVVVLSGGLCGPTIDPDRYEGSMAGATVFLGAGDEDPHVPVDRVDDTAAVFRSLDAAVTERIYEGVGHEVVDDEFAFVRDLVDAMVAG